MVVSPAGLETKDDCAGEDQQQFTRPDIAYVCFIGCRHCSEIVHKT
jgi:hypothetical protein